METCYMCDKPATSREHVPPKCLFPEPKDLPKGRNYRKNLITVPSCDEHNFEKSKDDQYLMLILVAPYETNLAAQRHFSKKIKRSLLRNLRLLGIYKNLTPMGNTGIFEVDKPRFESALKNIACGLYYHLHKEKWFGEIQILSNALLNSASTEYNLVLREFFQELSQLMSNHVKQGENLEVFYYQHEFTDKGEVFRMVFYGGMEVIALFSK